MSYLRLSNRAKTGTLLKTTNFVDGSFVNLIEISKPYKSGHKYTVYETTRSAFCSNGCFISLEQAIEKYNRMVKNNTYEVYVDNSWER